MEKYLGVVALAVIAFYVFRDSDGTSGIIASLGNANTNFIGALQGGNGARSEYTPSRYRG